MGSMENTGAGRIQALFADLKKQNKKALALYLMAGDPDVAFTEALVPRLVEAGADLVELGFPFSDPVADGPVIQAAAGRAIGQLEGLDSYLALVGRLRQKVRAPLVLMTYYNLIFHYGEEKFAQAAAQAGLDGVILPDLSLEEAEGWMRVSAQAGLDAIFLEAPNTTEGHAGQIAQASRGFIYMVSLKGVTGAAKGMGEGIEGRVARLRSRTQTPLMVGFGIATGADAARMGALSDGVIVGSALVNLLSQPGSAQQRMDNAVALVKELRRGLDGA